MLNNPYIQVAIASVGFAVYQWLARAAGMPSTLTVLFLLIFAAIPVLGINIYKAEWAIGSSRQMFLLVAGGLFLGIGFAAYAELMTNRGLDLSVWASIAAVCITAVTVAGAIYFFQESITLARIAGFALIIAAIWLIE